MSLNLVFVKEITSIFYLWFFYCRLTNFLSFFRFGLINVKKTIKRTKPIKRPTIRIYFSTSCELYSTSSSCIDIAQVLNSYWFVDEIICFHNLCFDFLCSKDICHPLRLFGGHSVSLNQVCWTRHSHFCLQDDFQCQHEQ